MNVEIRSIQLCDINRVVGIEREAFPTLWPPTPLKSEIGNRVSKYLVACEVNPGDPPSAKDVEYNGHANGGSHSAIGRVLGFVKDRFSTGNLALETDYFVVGYVGIWFMPDEAHVTAIAVEEASRGKGLGELLLIGCIEAARRRRAKVVSLETRVTNFIAQSLYQKYGFEEVGLRRAYYTDNREDAVIMTTEPISSSVYSERFRHLCQEYERRYGQIRMAIP